MTSGRLRSITATVFALSALATMAREPVRAPEYSRDLEQAAERMNTAARTRLAPVYPAMAEWLIERYTLSKAVGIGVDLGGGPGNLIVEMATRAPAMYWINADINTYNFPHLFAKAAKAGVEHRVGAVFADAHALPFKDQYADIVVSRGTFQFWKDQPTAFREIYRILKPGGTALIGRGYTDNLDPAVAARIRKSQGDGGPKYDIDKTAAELKNIMQALGIERYDILTPVNKEQPDVKYGIWLEIRKPAMAAEGKASE